ncbi:TPA: O34 family O-antigen polymerase [Escherichia coli]|nr:O34 family O-antigen polymerase [Escherichia coli]HAV9001635.1 O34 family O-antigen polymerase [Escherichia coli]HAW5354063.1 O34 family O-antigen polymerase [Escherichia coli]HAW5462455.1 O34 family O-antigen polymerase [Escherichia coli]HCH7357599.1 O34 family O-antigen polymerase [Escherichia coli]
MTNTNYIYNEFIFRCLFFFLISGLITLSTIKPEGFDHDYKQYLYLFELYKNSIDLGFGYEVEPLFIYLSRLVNFFNGGIVALLFIYTAVALICKCIFIKRCTKKTSQLVFFVFLYSVIFYPIHELTQIRISLALGLLLWGSLQKNKIIFAMIMLLTMLSHYSLIPSVIFISLFRYLNDKIVRTQVLAFIALLCFVICLLLIFYMSRQTIKYDGTNMPFYFYFLHPYSLIMLFSLFYMRRYIKNHFYYQFLYILAMLYYFLFLSFLFLQSQIAAFRFMEIALFFMFILIFIINSSFKSSIIKMLMLILVVTMFLYEHVIAIEPILNFDILHNSFSKMDTFQ